MSGYGGLIIHVDGQKWNWFSETKDGTVIQFLMEFDNLSWVDFIKKLLGAADEEMPCFPKPNIDFTKKEELVLPEKNKICKQFIENPEQMLKHLLTEESSQ